MKDPRLNGVLVLAGLFLLTAFSAHGAEIKGDAEAASHGDEAASLQVVEKESLPNFVFRQYELGVLSHYSYLIGSAGEAMIVDPARDVARYLKDAEELGLKVTRVYLTHSHADFIAGHMEIMKATGAEIIVNKLTGAGFKHREATDNTEIRFGDVRAVVKTTPGHTPDGTCLYVYHPASGPQPKLVLTGDTLFIGSVGRPDLLEGTYTSAQLASMLFDTWNQTLSKVPDATKLFPAHGAGSLCGVHLSDQPVSTFGEQKKVNPYLQHRDRSSFVMAVIDGLREPPQYFKHNAGLNRKGPDPVQPSAAMPAPLSPQEAAGEVEKGAWLVDVRNAKEFAASHASGAINIAVRGRFETWTGIMVPWGAPLVLIGPDAEVQEAASRLRRIGYDTLKGYVKGGMSAWEKEGLPSKKISLVKPLELHKQMQAGTAPIIVDVRLPNEWMALRIGHVLNLPLDRLFYEAKRLDPEMPLLMVCNSAYRSSMAGSIMQKLGFKDVRNLEGGGEAWITAGLPTYGAESSPQAATTGVYVKLPESMSPEDLAKRLMDLPGSLDVFDVRPGWQFKEYHIPGSVNVAVQELMGNPAYLNEKRPMVIVCRDGSISAAIGGVLVQNATRPIRFLSGGVMRYYDEIVRPKGILSDRMGPVAPAIPGPGPQPGGPGMTPQPQGSGAPVAPAPAPPPPKKKSAGC